MQAFLSVQKILYREGYAYQLAQDYALPVGIYPDSPVETTFLRLDPNGNLEISAGYAWDGATGMADSPDLIRGSLVHDALYQLMRLGHLSPIYRESADRLLQKICREDGMKAPLAQLVYFSVTLLANFAVDPKSERPILQAPTEPVGPLIFSDRESP